MKYYIVVFSDLRLNVLYGLGEQTVAIRALINDYHQVSAKR